MTSALANGKGLNRSLVPGADQFEPGASAFADLPGRLMDPKPKAIHCCFAKS